MSVVSAVSGLQIPASLQNADGTPKVSNSALRPPETLVVPAQCLLLQIAMHSLAGRPTNDSTYCSITCYTVYWKLRSSDMPCPAVLCMGRSSAHTQMPAFADAVIGISIAILILLFVFQRLGTSKVGFTFSPIVVYWYVLNGGCGIYNIVRYCPGVFKVRRPTRHALFAAMILRVISATLDLRTRELRRVAWHICFLACVPMLRHCRSC